LHKTQFRINYAVIIMLIEFSVQNFRSFKERATLSLEASTDDWLEDECVATAGGLRLLKSAAIFGANAGGKSNLLKAMAVSIAVIAIAASSVLAQTNGLSPLAPGNADAPASQNNLTSNSVSIVQILPSDTDPGIKTFNFPHTLFVNRDIVVEHRGDLAQDRHELLVFIPGTHETNTPRGGRGPIAFCKLAANLGYHVVNLIYPDEIPASVCANDPPRAFENFRMAIIQGGVTTHITVAKSESIENRLIKLLQHLKEIRPRENWGQFLNADGTIKWESIAVAGQSQGGGHAALIGIKHQVERVICTGAPKDFNHRINAPAAWYHLEAATPKSRFFTFNHRQDETGSTSPKQLLKM
jgi:hypothetical protein